MQISRYMSVVLCAFLASFCGKDNHSDENKDRSPIDDAEITAAEGLVFTTVDSQYTSSSLHYFDLASGKIKNLLEGESGDPWLALAGSNVYLFNRRSPTLNFRKLPVTTWKATAQTAVPKAENGDPHAMLMLDDSRMLLAHYNAGKLVIVDPDDGRLLQDVTAPWDLGDSQKARLRIEDFYVHEKGGEVYIYALHQGLNREFTVDGTQQVFVFKDDGNQLQVIDQNDDKDKIQGIPLTFSLPMSFFPQTFGGPIIASTCNPYSGADCKAGFEQLNLDTYKTTVIYDLGDSGYLDNGGVIPSSTVDTDFYALMVDRDNTRMFVTKIDIKEKSVTEFYAFPEGSRGCCGLYSHRGKLYVGDTGTADPDVGVLKIFDTKTGKEIHEISLPGRPYNGVFIKN